MQSQLAGLRDARVNKQEQLAALREQLQNMRELAREGYVPRNRLLDTERLFAQINGEISSDLGTIGRTQSQIAELKLRASLRREDNQKEVRTLLGDTQRDVQTLQSRLEALDFDLANTQLRAPVSGTVVGLSVFTEGGVVGPGAKLMDIVPDGEPLEMEAQVLGPSDRQGQVRPPGRTDVHCLQPKQNSTYSGDGIGGIGRPPDR
ncbi:HlyD family efflux transporter periplasmic adaptor subunit [Cupriavidus basilensis]